MARDAYRRRVQRWVLREFVNRLAFVRPGHQYTRQTVPTVRE